MTAPKVSVVVPTHNRSQFLKRALASILSQTEQSFEVFVVDDGSPADETAQMVASYGDVRFHFIRLPERRGPASARNAGIRRARGPYIAFLDDDDEWLPEKLARQVRVLEAASLDVGGVCTARFTVNANTGTIVETRCTSEHFDGPLYRNPITTSSLLLRRQCFETVGEFDEQLEASSDFDMWLRISLVYRFTCLDEPLVRYFVHGDQISTSYGKKARSSARILEKHAALFQRDPKAFSRSLVVLGILCCRSGAVSRGRRALLKAIQLNPRSGTAYLHLALSLLGSTQFDAILRRRSGSQRAAVTHVRARSNDSSAPASSGLMPRS